MTTQFNDRSELTDTMTLLNGSAVEVTTDSEGVQVVTLFVNDTLSFKGARLEVLD